MARCIKRWNYNYMQFDLFIEGQFIDLERFTNKHISELESIAIDPRIWQNLPYNITDKTSFDSYIKDLQNKNLSTQQVTYVIRNKANKQVCGSTGFVNIDAVNQQLEIGTTWLSPNV